MALGLGSRGNRQPVWRVGLESIPEDKARHIGFILSKEGDRVKFMFQKLLLLLKSE